MPRVRAQGWVWDIGGFPSFPTDLIAHNSARTGWQQPLATSCWQELRPCITSCPVVVRHGAVRRRLAVSYLPCGSKKALSVHPFIEKLAYWSLAEVPIRKLLDLHVPRLQRTAKSTNGPQLLTWYGSISGTPPKLFRASGTLNEISFHYRLGPLSNSFWWGAFFTLGT